jgi:hypothetical protein
LLAIVDDGDRIGHLATQNNRAIAGPPMTAVGSEPAVSYRNKCGRFVITVTLGDGGGEGYMRYAQVMTKTHSLTIEMFTLTAEMALIHGARTQWLLLRGAKLACSIEL